MGSDGQFRSLARFLYTQNPFYLISCFLIIYGLQIATQSYSDLGSRSILLTVSLGGYMLLMALTSVGVIRLGKVWDDARSILLVVVISQLALSSGVDELCNSNWKEGGRILLFAGVFSVAITEFVLRICRIRLHGWYRLSFYAILAVFFAMPVVLGRAVEERQLGLTNWGAPLFSTLIGAGLLLMAPAIRNGRRFVRRNGTPWRWPLYPLSAFVIIIVLASIRTHAIWMSFGYIGASTRFEPFLLMPIAFALLVLLTESTALARVPSGGYTALACTPILLALGSSRGGLTYLPIQSDLQDFCGSAMTIAVIGMLVFYAYAWVRRVRFSEHAFALTLLGFGFWGELPEVAESAGVQHWMFTLLATATYLILCLRSWNSDVLWLAFSAIASVTIARIGDAFGYQTEGLIVAGTFAIAMLLVLGACFNTNLALAMRHVAAAALVFAAGGIVAWHLSRSPGNITVAILSITSAVTLVYVPIVKRLGWLYIFGVQVACLCVVFGFTSYESGAYTGANLPIKSGILCFVIGVTISSLKTGMYQRFVRKRPTELLPTRYSWGL